MGESTDAPGADASVFVEFDLGSTVLREALRAAPGTRATSQDLATSEETPGRLIFWAEGGDFDAFEAGLDADPTVEEWSLLTDADGRRLYRVTYPEKLADVDLYRTAVDHDGVVLATVSEGDGWRTRMCFPDRHALGAFRERCEALDVPVELRVVTDTDFAVAGGSPKLTPPQREALLVALEAGYFEVPRGASLADLASELGISAQAVSERLRRGVATLLRASLARGEVH